MMGNPMQLAMFWKINSSEPPPIDTLLAKENVTIREILDEEDVLQECKAQYKPLIEYLTRPDIMAEMVNLITCEPQEDAEEKAKYKYSNIASELLTSDVSQINDTLANDKSLLNKLFSFLENDNKPLNPLLASFFTKVMGTLISRKTEQAFEFLQSKDFVNLVVNHLRTSAIMDLLLRLVNSPENANLRLDILNWLNQQQIIQRLLSLIDPVIEEERHCNASQAVCDIIRMARDQHNQLQEKLEFDPLLQTIETSEVITDLLSHMFSGEKSESVLVNGILVLLTLLEVKKPMLNAQLQQQNEQSSMYFRPEAQETMTPQDEERQRQSVTRTAIAIQPRIKDFHQLLLEPPKKHPISTTVGTLDPPLGSTRIYVSRLFSALVAANVNSVNNELCTVGSLDVILDLFFQYTWNNFIHTQVEQCIGSVLSNSPTEDETGCQCHPLLDYLFVKCNLLQRILGAWEDNEKEELKSGGHRRGYMGHLTQIANHIVENVENGCNSALITQKINELSQEVKDKWEAFISGPLAEINKKNLIVPIKGTNMQLSSEDDADTVSYQHETTLQQAFSDYQMQQMTSNFIDQFGFDNDEFGEHEDNVNAPLERLTSVSFSVSAEEDARRDLFERACNERIRPLDDADSDEDIWDEKEITFANVIDRRPGPPIGSRLSQVGSNHNANLGGDDESKLVSVSNSTPIPSSDEMKMDIDQGDASWSTNFDPVPMDTGNPWESPSHTDVPSMPATSQDSGWADFGNFADFGSTKLTQNENALELPSSSPVAMETSEDLGFKQGESNLIPTSVTKATEFSTQSVTEKTFSESSTTCRRRAKSDSEVFDVESRIPLPGADLAKACSTSEAAASSSLCTDDVGDGKASATKSNATPDISTNVKKTAHQQSSDCLDANFQETCSSSKMGRCHLDTDECDDISKNFDFLVSSGLMKTGEDVVEGTQENGPSNAVQTSNPDVSLQTAKIEEARVKALESFEQLTSTAGPTSNGPV